MSFFEVLVVAIVGLIVIGPDKLPETIRTLMLWFGRIKRTVTDTRNEFEQQLGLDEIRRELHNEQVLKALAKMESSKNTIQNTADDVKNELREEIRRIENSIDDPVPHDDEPEDSPARKTPPESPENT
jgi:sec-independent protein translocase protein TatB